MLHDLLNHWPLSRERRLEMAANPGDGFVAGPAASGYLSEEGFYMLRVGVIVFAIVVGIVSLSFAAPVLAQTIGERLAIIESKMVSVQEHIKDASQIPAQVAVIQNRMATMENEFREMKQMLGTVLFLAVSILISMLAFLLKEAHQLITRKRAA